MQQRQSQAEETPTLDPKLLERLGSKKERERAAAEQAIEQLGPEAVDRLLETLRAEAAKRKRRQRRWITLYLSFLALMALGTIALSFRHGEFDGTMLSQIGSMSGMIGAAFAVSAASKNGAKKLAEFDDIRTVGPLAEALEYQDKGIRALAEQRLIHLLPQMKASDAALLNDDQRACLNRALKGKNRESTRAILKAYEQVGDSKAIPVVEKLAAGDYAAKKDAQLQADAQGCLEFLRAKAEIERASKTLLRASCASDMPADILLRPASGTTEADPSQLLRAASQENASGFPH